MESFVEHILVHYRWIFVIFFLLPLSLLYDVAFAIRAYIVFKLASAPTKHPQKVQAVQEQVQRRVFHSISHSDTLKLTINFVNIQVKRWAAGPREAGMCTARPGWQTISFRVPKYKSILTPISVNLVDILDIVVDEQTVTVEPLVSMGQLTATLEPLGWSLPVLPELDDLTVGGLVMGTGIETSSHKYGLFQHICKSFELVIPSGEVVTCSVSENKDLFDSVPWSYGTLGFLTAVKLQIIPAQRFVKVEYRAAHSLKTAVEIFNRETLKGSGNEFVEGLLFSRDSAVIMTANMVTSAEPGKVFFLHVVDDM